MCNEFENIEPVVPLYENIHNGYQVTTIAKILNRINKDLFIPAIQRPYVWSPEQVVSLFDSLMSGYPIGALMIWNRPPNNPDNWKIYKFIKDFIKRNIHNDLYNIDENQPVSLVLDGQQRLTTLLIGLQGTYTYGAGGNPPKKILYLNLAYLPHILDENIIEDDDINPIAAHYNFEFFDNNITPPNRHGKIWFRVSNILGMEDLLSLEQQINNLTAVGDNVAFLESARVNLRRLWQAIWQNNSITYFTEYGNETNRVLDIFIRANSGGRPLNNEDLLMALITTTWSNINAREQVEEITDSLNRITQTAMPITRRFILRSLLFFNGFKFTIVVQNFSRQNLNELEKNFIRSKLSLEYTATLLAECGLSGANLISTNAIMMLSFYFFKQDINFDTYKISKQNKELIRRWVIWANLKGLYAVQTNQTLLSFRSTVALVITEAQEVPEVKFPWQQIATTFRNGNHDLDYNEHTLTRWCDTPITGANEVIGSLYLSLLYNDSLSNQKRSTYILHRTGHFQIGNLNNHGIIEEDIPKIQSYANKLILSFALDEAEANIFNNTPYNQWINALTPEFIKLHYLPSDKNLYTLANLPKWVEERKKLIAERLKNLFNEL